MKNNSLSRAVLLVAFLVVQLTVAADAIACACGCGIFDVGTSLMLPNGNGGMAYLEYDFMNQKQNWHATKSADGNALNDKDIKTSYATLGVQYFFNRSFGIQVDVPYVSRHFESVNDDTGILGSFDHSAVGDIRLRGYYTGFSEDMSTGINFGVKLPTGPTKTPGFDFDTQIGTGSTDLLLGIYHLNNISADRLWTGFSQFSLQQSVLTQNDYIPGSEIAAVYGVYYHGIALGATGSLVPMLQAKASVRASDHGANGDADNTGYTRLMAAPGLEASFGSFKIYADVSLPFYQYMAGNQLVSNYLFKSLVAYYF